MGSKSTTGLNLLFSFLPKAKYKTYQMHFQYYWLLNISFRYFRACFRYFREYCFSFILTFIKKPLEIKAVSSKHFNSPSLLFFPCTESSQPKVFFDIAASRRATPLLQRLLKSQGFSLSLSWQLCWTAISKSTFSSCRASKATFLDYTVDYIIQYDYG